MSAEAVRAVRRFDPARRDRIVDACLELIAEAGVDGVSHRKVAARADVPLGSMTYHFAGMDDLLRAAFERFARTVSDRFETLLAAAPDRAAAEAAVVRLIQAEVFASPRDLVLSHELYTLAARQPAFRDITNAWMARSRHALERHFDPLTARLLDALIEGLTIHAALDTAVRDPADALEAVHRIVGVNSVRDHQR